MLVNIGKTTTLAALLGGSILAGTQAAKLHNKYAKK